MRTISTNGVASAIRDAYADGLDFDGADDGADSAGFDPGDTRIDWSEDPNEDRTLARCFAIADLESLHQRLASVEAQIRRTGPTGRKSPWHRVRLGHRASLRAQIAAQQELCDAMA